MKQTHTMKQTLIKITDDHYVVVDDSEIKKGDWCLYANKFGGKFICQAYVYERTLMFDDGSFNRSLGEGITPQKDECKKITHSTQPVDNVNGFPAFIVGGIQEISLQEVKELIGEVDVEKKAEKFIGCEYDDIEDSIDQIGYDSFIKGYKQSLEDNKEKKYTEKDIIGFYYWLKKNYGSIKPLEEGQIRERTTDIGILNKYIQSLQPKTEWDVEFIDGNIKLK